MDREKTIDAFFREFDHATVPGVAVAVRKDGQVVFAKGYGLADLERKIPCTTHTNFRLASLTKQFTALSILMLIEQGKLSLDDRLSGFFPDFTGFCSPWR